MATVVQTDLVPGRKFSAPAVAGSDSGDEHSDFDKPTGIDKMLDMVQGRLSHPFRRDAIGPLQAERSFPDVLRPGLKVLLSAGLLAAGWLLSSCNSKERAGDGAYTLKFGHLASESHTWHQEAVKF